MKAKNPSVAAHSGETFETTETLEKKDCAASLASERIDLVLVFSAW